MMVLDKMEDKKMTQNNSKFFKTVGILAFLVITSAFIFSKEFVSSFSHNLIKTTGAVYLCLIILYAFIVLYRFLAKRKRLLTFKEILITLVFLFGLYDLALLADKILVLTDRDLDAMPSNIITYILILLFLLFQKYIFRHEVK